MANEIDFPVRAREALHSELAALFPVVRETAAGQLYTREGLSRFSDDWPHVTLQDIVDSVRETLEDEIAHSELAEDDSSDEDAFIELSGIMGSEGDGCDSFLESLGTLGLEETVLIWMNWSTGAGSSTVHINAIATAEFGFLMEVSDDWDEISVRCFFRPGRGSACPGRGNQIQPGDLRVWRHS